MDLTLLPAIVADALGSSERLQGQYVMVERHDYVVVIGRLARSGQRVTIKLAGPGAPHWAGADAFERAPVVSGLVRRQGVAVPEVLAVDTSCRRWPVRCPITTFRAGMTWATARPWFIDRDRDALFAELGDTVGRVHGLRFAAFGELLPSGTVRAVSSYVRALSERAARRIAHPAHVELFQDLIARHRRVLDAVGPPCLAHEDLNPTNLLVERREHAWHLAGILDLDSAWAGNPESDLARLELWRGMMHPRFRHAYAAAHRVADSYANRRALLQLLWCLEYARPIAEHHAVTAAVCDELGIAPVAFA